MRVMKCVKLKDEDLYKLKFPLIGSVKIDGIRCVVIDGQALTASMKLIPNEHIQECLSKSEYNYLDGELTIGRINGEDTFNRTTGAVRKKNGHPDFSFNVFDRFESKELSFKKRWLDCMNNYEELKYVNLVPQKVIQNEEELLGFESESLKNGYEGIMIRSLKGKYKEGRATLKENIMFKRKPLFDDEAQIIGFGEQMKNLNKQTINELGLSTRASNKENKVSAGTLGFFVVKSDKWEKPFHIGTGNGLTQEMREKIWNDKEKYLGETITYVYQAYGSIDAPRIPIIKGFRMKEDLTEY